MRRHIFALAALVLTAFGVPADLHAQSATAQLQVAATVIRRCTILTADVAFGNYDPVTGNATAPLDGNGTLTVTCTQGTSATVAIDNGSNAVAGQRRMNGGTSFLTYELYRDAGRTQVWGTTGPQSATLPPAPSIAPRTLTVYGRVPPTQDVTVGSYTDRAVATVNF